MYKCTESITTFIFRISDLETPIDSVVTKGSLWMKLVGEVGSGDYIVRLRSNCGVYALDLTEEEFYENFERMN